MGYPEEEPGHLQSKFSSIPSKAGVGCLLWKIAVLELDAITLPLSGFHNAMQRAMLWASPFLKIDREDNVDLKSGSGDRLC